MGAATARRLLVLWTAFVAMTGTFLVLPVYAAPGPEPVPVDTSTTDVAMGSVADPAPAAEVAEGLTEPVGGVPETTPALTVRRTGTEPFSMVGVTWAYDAGVIDTVVQVRVQDAGGDWGEWTTLEVEAEQERDAAADAPVRGGTSPLWTGPSTGVEAELVTRSGAHPTDVQLDLVDPGTSDADAHLEQAEITDTAHAASAMPAVYSRAQWGADERIRTWAPEYAPTIKAATIHHTADSNGYTAAQVPAILRGIYQYHAVDRGWGDIGYNVIADKFGRLWEGRYGGLASTVIGAHAGGFNTGTFGVSMLGNYGQVAPSPALINAVSDIIAWKFALYRVNPNATVALTSAGGGTARWPAGTTVSLPAIFGHRDVGNTTCPGDYGYARLGDIRELVTKKMAGFGTPVLGNLENFSVRAQTVSIKGWAYDPEQPTAPVTVKVSVNGTDQPDVLADQPRADVGLVHPEAGANHGYNTTLTIPIGDQFVCVRIEPVSAETLPSITCQILTAIHPDRLLEPVGSVEAISADGRRIAARGWTYDLDTPSAPLDVHVYVNGGWGGAYRADRTRTDVGRAHPDAGNAHGFELSLSVPGPGSYDVCIFAINQNGGSINPQLGCRTVQSPVANWSPAGNLDSATMAGRRVTTSGWTFDLDTPAQALSVHRYVDGVYAGAFPANGTRADVGRIYPTAGNGHGYTSTSGDLRAGKHTVCLYAINTGPGANSTLGCRSVTVAASAWNPFGNFDGVKVGNGVVLVGGWAIDPDAWTSPVRVQFLVDERPAGTVTGGRPRADVGRVHPDAGAAHGFGAYLVMGRGTHRVCAIGLNVGQGTAGSNLGCRSITVP
jgi:hypothetical protein